MQKELTPPPTWLVMSSALGAMALLTGVLLWRSVTPEPPDITELPQSPPDFADLPAGPDRKTAFIRYLTPLIDSENATISADRATLLSLRERKRWTDREAAWLRAVAERYAVVENDDPEPPLIVELLERVDTIPLSLALAQAAKESGWGTSRFARDGHNYFGQRCYVAGCGIVPAARTPGLRHEVTRFDTPRLAVRSYLRNLNTHEEYTALRAYRSAMRTAGNQISGAEMAASLGGYSERRHRYIEEIQSLIQFNQLERDI